MNISLQEMDQVLGLQGGGGNADDPTKDKKPAAPTAPPKPAPALPAPGQASLPAQGLQAPMAAPKQTHTTTLSPAEEQAPTLPSPEAPTLPGPSSGIPSLPKPTKKESQAAGKQEYNEGMPQSPEALGLKPGDIGFGSENQAIANYKEKHPLGADVSADNSTWGKIKHGLSRVGNIAGDMLVPGMMAAVPGSDVNKSEQAKGNATWENMGVENKLKEAQTKKANNPVDKYSFHYQGPDGTEFGVRPDGTAEEVGTGQVTPARERQSNIAAYGANPNDAAAKKKVEDDPSTWQKSIPFMGRIENGQLVADPSVKTPILIDRNLVTGTNTAVGSKPASGGKPTYKNVAVDADHEQLNVFDDPNDPTKGRPIGAVSKKGQFQVWTNPDDPNAAPKLFDPSKGQLSEMPQGGAGPGGALPPQAARAEVMRQGQFQTGYLKPATDIEQNYQKANAALAAYNANPKTGAAGMVEFATHLATTLGSVKGAAIGETSQMMHMNATGLADKAQRYLDYIATGQPLSKDQMTDFNDLVAATRQISWQTAAHVGQYRNMPLSFLPNDVQLHVMTPGGKHMTITGGQAAEAVKDGLKIE